MAVRARALAVALPVVTGGVLAISASTAWAATTGSVTVSPSSGLTDGQSVTVTGSGFPANTGVFVLQCSGQSGQAACDLGHLTPVTTNASGGLTATFTVHTGTIGNGKCDPGSSNCIIAVGTADQSATGAAPISFKAASTGGGTTGSTGGSTTGSTGGSTSGSTGGSTGVSGSGTSGGGAAPSAVSAGTGGTADQDGLPVGAIAGLAVAGVGLAGVSARKLARR